MTDESPQTAAPTPAPPTPAPATPASPAPAAPNRAPGAHRRSSPAGRDGRAPRGGRGGAGAALSVARPVAVLGALAVVIAACGSSGANAGPTTSGTTATTTGGTGTPAASTGGGGAATATVELATTSSGKVLENSSGMALYTFGPDHGGAQSKCTGACLEAWPPLTVPAGTTPTAGSGVAGTLGTSKQSDGALQVTYDGNLLYTFLSDQPGQVTGNGVAGFSVARAATPTPAATTTTAARGYNY